MEIDEDRAKKLCHRVALELSQWRAFQAVIQLGGIETRASSQIHRAIETWLAEQQDNAYFVIPEFRLDNSTHPDETTDSRLHQAADTFRSGRIDYALVPMGEIGRPRMSVNTVIEVKSNYLSQRSELRTRPFRACTQARAYAARWEADAYVLYIVVSVRGQTPPVPSDAGWKCFDHKAALGTVGQPLPANQKAGKSAKIVGQYHQRAIPGLTHKGPGNKWSAEFWVLLLEA